MPLDTAPLATIKVRLRACGERLFALDASSTHDQVREIRDELAELVALLGLLVKPAGTNCARHPYGPVDPQPPPSGGSCMLCNTLRQRGLPPAQRPTNIVRRPV